MYHSYSMQVHGYVSSNSSGGRGSFTLVHGVSQSLSKMDLLAVTMKQYLKYDYDKYLHKHLRLK